MLLTYENEAIAAQLAGQKVQYVIPRSTILIENPIAVLKDSANKDTANAFVRFLKTPAAQQVFADRGYRPIIKSVLQAQPEEVPRPARAVHDRPARPRRLDEGAEDVLRSETSGVWRRSSGRWAASTG